MKECGHEKIVKDDQFYYRGKYFSGLVCEECNALYDNPDDSFFEYVGKVGERMSRRKRREVSTHD